MNHEITLAKRQRRKVERKWRASKAHVDLLWQSYHTMRNRVTLLSNKAHSDYFTNFIIENSTDQRRLFRASKSLLNLSKGSGLPLSTNNYQMANEFTKLFAQKIAAIRSAITNQICLPVTINTTTRWSGDVMKRPGHKNFNAVSHNRSRPELLFLNLTWRLRGQISLVLLQLLLFAFSNRKFGRHGKWSVTFWHWENNT